MLLSLACIVFSYVFQCVLPSISWCLFSTVHIFPSFLLVCELFTAFYLSCVFLAWISQCMYFPMLILSHYHYLRFSIGCRFSWLFPACVGDSPHFLFLFFPVLLVCVFSSFFCCTLFQCAHYFFPSFSQYVKDLPQLFPFYYFSAFSSMHISHFPAFPRVYNFFTAFSNVCTHYFLGYSLACYLY